MDLNFLGQPIENPNDRGLSHAVLAITWVFTALCIVTIILRLYLRRHVSTSTQNWDDWTMLAAVVFQVLAQVFLTKSCLWGFGSAYTNLTLIEYVNTQKWEFITIPFSYLAELLARASIAILLTRIFGLTRPWFKWLLIGYTILIWIAGLVGIALLFAQIQPLPAFWDPRIKPTHAISQYVQSDESLVFQFLIDIYDLIFVILPVAFIWKLNMALQRKLALIFLISVSLITVGVQTAKIALSLQGILGQIAFRQAGTIGAVFYIVTFVEQGVVIVLGSVPALGPITQLKFSGLLSSIGNSLTRLVTRRGSTDSSQHQDIEMGPKPRASDDGPLL